MTSKPAPMGGPRGGGALRVDGVAASHPLGLLSSDIPFRVFRNPQVAKGWLIDCWLQHQEDLGLVDAYEEVESSSLG